MFGFVIGALSLIGLIKVIRRGRYGYGYGGYGGHGGWGGGGIGRSWMLRRLFQRLETTPGQEKVILEAIENVQKVGYKAKEDLRAARTAVANAVKGDAFDTAAVNEVLDKQQSAIDEVKKTVLAGLQSIHEALNPEQRKLVGELIEFGPRAMHGGYGGGCGGRGHWHGRFARGGYGRGPFGRGGPGDAVNL